VNSTAARTAHHPSSPLSPLAPPGPDAGLARSGLAELELAHDHRDALVVAATLVTAAAGHDPDVADCGDAGCRLAALDTVGMALCAVAHRLSRLPGAPTLPAPGDLAAATTGFATALVASADAIRACRQTAHAVGACWFSPAPGIDGCGDVLRLLHRWG
jgi:hypothetical protein